MIHFNFKKIWLKISSVCVKKPKQQSWQRQQEKFKKRYPHYTIGAASYGMPVVYDYAEGATLKIGAYCSIASNVQIFLGGQHRIDWVSSYPFPFFNEMGGGFKATYGGSRGDVIIGSDVWLCANCTILSGVTIGHGAVIANGALISKDVAPYAVMAGNPAQLIKWRFDEPTRKALLATNWWEWSENEIEQVREMLCSDSAEAIIQYATLRK